MRPRRTTTTTSCFALPGGNEDNDLWVEPQLVEGVLNLTSYWLPDEEDLARLNAGAAVALHVMGGMHPPVIVCVHEVQEFKA